MSRGFTSSRFHPRVHVHRWQRSKKDVFLCTATYKSGPLKGDRCFASTSVRCTVKNLYDKCEEALCAQHLAFEKRKKMKGRR